MSDCSFRGFEGVASDEFVISLLWWLYGLRRMSRTIRVLSWSWIGWWMEALVPSPRTTLPPPAAVIEHPHDQERLHRGFKIWDVSGAHEAPTVRRGILDDG